MAKPSVAVFTVKRFHRWNGGYWTYGGFGEWLSTILPHFELVRIVGHVKTGPPPSGWYPVANPRLQFVELPWAGSEAAVLFTLPLTFMRGWRAVGGVDLVCARMPDYTGIAGNWIGRLRRKRIINYVIADWAVQARALAWTKKGGLGAALKLHLWAYDVAERLSCRGQLTFAHGESCYVKHRSTADAVQIRASAHRVSDIADGVPERAAGPRPLRILTVARLDSVKNHELVLRALRTIGDRWEAVFVGDGPQRRRLEQLAGELGVRERVTFAGVVEHGPGLWQQYDRADVFVLASRSEGSPKVLLEAMARALPVVATAVGGVPSVVTHGTTGLLVPDNDHAALVDALRQVASDAQLRRRVINGGLELARRTTLESHAQELMSAVYARWPGLKNIPRPAAPVSAPAHGTAVPGA